MNFKEINNLDNEFIKFLNSIKFSSKKICLYGSGRGAYWVIKLLALHNIKPQIIIDSNKSSGDFQGIQLINKKEFFSKFNKNDYVYIIASPKYELNMHNELLNEKIDEKSIFSFESEIYVTFIQNINEYKKYIIDNASKLTDVYNNLEDEFSKRTFESFILGRVTGKLSYFYNVRVDNQYFENDVIKLSENEVFLDIGAYIGDTLVDYIEKSNGKYNKIVCLEPDKSSFSKLKDVVNKLHLKNIQLINKGAYNKNTFMSFNSSDSTGTSKIIQNDSLSNQIEVTKIDDICDNASLIKMDIEGSELEALMGAKKVIKRCKPALAICVYHKKEDLYNVFNYINSLNCNYKFYLRHHNYSATETVLYAVQK